MADYFDEHDGDPEWECWNIMLGNVPPSMPPLLIARYVETAQAYAEGSKHLDRSDCHFVGGRGVPGELIIRWWYPIAAKPPEGTVDVTRLVCEHCAWVSEASVRLDETDEDTLNAGTRAWTVEGDLHRWRSPAHHLRFDLRVEHPGSEHIFNRDGGTACVCGEVAA